MSFGIPMFRDLFTEPQLRNARLCLVDIDRENLERMYALAEKMNEAAGFEVELLGTENRREVLPEADFVINSLAIERCELWRKDFEIPKKYGIRHTLGENGGAGALFFSMRTIPVILDICRDMEELCPDAWFLNFSNPETRIIYAVSKFTKIKCAGLCHGIFMAAHDIAYMMGRNEQEIEVFGAGMNHFQWVMGIRDRKSGENLYPVFRKAELKADTDYRPFSRKLFHAFGYYPSPSDDHIGEYLAYGYEAGEEGYDFEADEQWRKQTIEMVEEVLKGKRDAGEWLEKSGEKAVELLTAMYFDRKSYIPSVIVQNNGAIPSLPDDVAVEVPAIADGNGLHKLQVEALPEGISGLMQGQVAPQRLSVSAAVKGSRETALQCLLCDPTVNSMAAAEGIVDELWKINESYIRECDV